MSALGRPRLCPEDVIRRVVEMRLAGASLPTIARQLNDGGVPTPAGKGNWQAAHVSNLLKTRSGRRITEELSVGAGALRRGALCA